ncbi:MAG: hypothetical protein ACXVHS_04505, partial [Methanobacterium sp.]
MSIAFIPINGNIRPPIPYIAIFSASNVETDEVGRYLTPLSAKGMSRGIMIALKITADNTALAG